MHLYTGTYVPDQKTRNTYIQYNICAYTFFCMYVFEYVYVYVYAYAYGYVYVYAYVYVYVFMYLYYICRCT